MQGYKSNDYKSHFVDQNTSDENNTKSLNKKYNINLNFKCTQGNSIDIFELSSILNNFGKTILNISDVLYNKDAKENLFIKVDANKQGSFESVISLAFKNIFDPGLFPTYASILTFGVDIMTAIKNYFEIKSSLQGNKINKLVSLDNGSVNVYGDNNIVINGVKDKDIKILLNPQVNRTFSKVALPLVNEQSSFTSIAIDSMDIEKMLIDKNNYESFIKADDYQNVNFTFKGRISKIDKKVKSGYIDIENRRLGFDYKNLPLKYYSLLFDSLSKDIEIIIEGITTFDLIGNPKHIEVISIEKEKFLLVNK